jgi:hypothetical protein
MGASQENSSINIFSVLKNIESVFEEIKDNKMAGPGTLLLIVQKHHGNSSGYFENDARAAIKYFSQHPEVIGRDYLTELVAKHHFIEMQIIKGKLGVVCEEYVH